MLAWASLLACSVTAGATIVGLLVAPSGWQTGFAILSVIALVVTVHSFTLLITEVPTGQTAVLALLFILAGLSGGFWVAAASLVGRQSRRRAAHSTSTPCAGPSRRAVVVLSNAEPERYDYGATARRLARLIHSGALTLPASAVPFVFLSEKARYHALRDFHPGRATARVIAEAVESHLRASGDADTVVVAWCDGDPSLSEQVHSLAAAGYTEIVLAHLGQDGSYLFTEAASELADAHMSHVRIGTAPSIWISDPLARRACQRVLNVTRNADPATVGVALLGEGQPPEWESLSREWHETEAYFTQRVRLMLAEHGIDERNVRLGWVEWQTPDITEVVRHLAATGCTTIVLAPVTIPVATLATALDFPRAIDSARLGPDVLTITLTPWGDDPALIQALVTAIKQTLSDKTD
ncbi:MAG: CbiX/SirB N-terminal domain-containing protein [Coriobacteriales bacterium]